MESTVGSAPSFHQYSLLSNELKLLIIEQFLLDHLDAPSFPLPRRHRDPLTEYVLSRKPLAKYVTVDILWNYVVEKITFQHLSLRVADIETANTIANADDLDRLERICVEDRINFVSEIHITIFLDDIRSQHTESSTDTTIAIGDQGNMAATIGETQLSTLHAERVSTTVFGRLFGILKSWSRDQKPLRLTYTLDRKSTDEPRNRQILLHRDTHLRIDASSFPEVTCVGSLKTSIFSGWGIQPASIFHILTKLPNARHAIVTFDADLESQVADIVKEGQPPLSLQESKLKTLWLTCITRWSRGSSDRLDRHPSLQLHQSIFPMSSRLENLYLINVVDVPYFLRESWRANGSTPHSLPAWPNLRRLRVAGYASEAHPNDVDAVRDLHDSITHALLQMPNITSFYVDIASASRRFSIGIGVPPRRDRSAMPDATLSSSGLEPDIETVDTWKKLVRSQWYCGLRKGDRDQILLGYY